MENNFKHRVSRLFSSSFESCRFKSVSDIVENSIIITQNRPNAHHIEPLSSTTMPIHPSTSTPRTPQMVREAVMKERPKESNTKNSPSSNGEWFSSEEEETFRSLSSDTSKSFRLKTAKSGRRRGSIGSSEMGCFPFDVSARLTDHSGSSRRETAKSQQQTRKVHRKIGMGGRCGYIMERKVQKKSQVSESSNDSNNDSPSVRRETTETGRKTAKTKHKTDRRTEWGCPELVMEREAQERFYESASSTALHHITFSSIRRKTTKTKCRTGETRWRTEIGSSQFVAESEVQESLKSPANSTDLYYRKSRRSSRKTTNTSRKTSRERGVSQCPLLVDGRVEESYAMVKTSSDPYSDFRVSMVEMIIEKQIFKAEDLERLLKCFLSLNSSHHHKVIVQVFSEICEALFTN